MATKKKSIFVHDYFYHEPEIKGTEFPIYKKIETLDKNGDVREKFEPMTFEDVKQRRLGSVFTDLGNGKSVVTPVDYSSNFDKFDTLESKIDNINPKDFEDE